MIWRENVILLCFLYWSQNFLVLRNDAFSCKQSDSRYNPLNFSTEGREDRSAFLSTQRGENLNLNASFIDLLNMSQRAQRKGEDLEINFKKSKATRNLLIQRKKEKASELESSMLINSYSLFYLSSLQKMTDRFNLLKQDEDLMPKSPIKLSKFPKITSNALKNKVCSMNIQKLQPGSVTSLSMLPQADINLTSSKSAGSKLCETGTSEIKKLGLMPLSKLSQGKMNLLRNNKKMCTEPFISLKNHK